VVAPTRILGVSVPDVSDWNDAVPRGKWSQFFTALAQRFELDDVVQAEVSRRAYYLNLARSFRPRKREWLARAGFNQSLARERTAVMEHGLRRHQGSYDLVMQLQAFCAPGAGTPYAIYTDNTMALTQRLYPAWAPLSRRLAAEWMRFEADVCNSAIAVLTFSEFARRSVIDDYGCLPERVAAVGAGANQVLDDLEDRHYAAPRALFAGMDFTRKGGHVLLEAWPTVREHVAGAELVIAGPSHDPRGADVAGVQWVGRVGGDELADLYRSASVFVLPSLFEPWGHVFLEAMGHGLPCIGTSCCAMPEIIDDGVTGRLVAPGEPEPLAAALIALLADPAKASAMGRAAHAKVANGDRWSDVIDRVAAQLGSARAGSV
jgi:glycosyltransferase involved in cell wall biosynthesis